jgi:hypothetical protein
VPIQDRGGARGADSETKQCPFKIAAVREAADLDWALFAIVGLTER